ncbi:hypothetical protein ABPG75_002771 [Micractinium tetrahymenae]
MAAAPGTPEMALERLRLALDRTPAEQRSPDAETVLAAYDGMAEAHTLLLEAAAGAPPPPGGAHWGWDGADRNPALFKSLVTRALSVARGFTACMPLAISKESTALLASCGVHPVVSTRHELLSGRPLMEMHVNLPPDTAGMTPVTALQLLATSHLLNPFTRYNEGQGMGDWAEGLALEACRLAMHALWPADGCAEEAQARARLQARGWVPRFRSAQHGQAAGGGRGGQEARQGAAGSSEQPLSRCAAALAADLRRHCPGVSLADIRWAALITAISYSKQPVECTQEQQCSALVDSQQLIDARLPVLRAPPPALSWQQPSSGPSMLWQQPAGLGLRLHGCGASTLCTRRRWPAPWLPGAGSRRATWRGPMPATA